MSFRRTVLALGYTNFLVPSALISYPQITLTLKFLQCNVQHSAITKISNPR
jgi:hypothetical protein